MEKRGLMKRGRPVPWKFEKKKVTMERSQELGTLMGYMACTVGGGHKRLHDNEKCPVGYFYN